MIQDYIRQIINGISIEEALNAFLGETTLASGIATMDTKLPCGPDLCGCKECKNKKKKKSMS